MAETQTSRIIDLEAYEFNLAVKMEVRKQLVVAFYDQGVSGALQTAHQITHSLGQWKRSSEHGAY